MNYIAEFGRNSLDESGSILLPEYFAESTEGATCPAAEWSCGLAPYPMQPASGIAASVRGI